MKIKAAKPTCIAFKLKEKIEKPDQRDKNSFWYTS